MKPSTIALVVALILAVGASFGLGWVLSRKSFKRPVERPDTVYVTRLVRDSAKQTSSAIVSKIPVFLPVFLPNGDTTEVHDTTTLVDSILVEVPFTEKTYEGENYKATVRGFQPELVDIWIKQRETTITVPYRKRWSLSVGPQVGVGITPKGFQPYAGAGVMFGYCF